MALMEGTLWKWTNYLSGWQPRYFVLEVGALSYYKSQEEVGRGSRGSIKMGCCEITVHPTDNVRIDLKIPPEQYIYLRAATSSERQQWLVALGTSKACIAQLNTKNQENDSSSSKVSQLKERMQELSMYRSLLLQQVNAIKLMCSEKQGSQDFNETATMLSATCDEFLKSLCDCMDLAEVNLSSTSDINTTPSKNADFRKKILQEPQSPSSLPTSPTSSFSSSSGSTLSASSSSTSNSETHHPGLKMSPQSQSTQKAPLQLPQEISTQTTSNTQLTNKVFISKQTDKKQLQPSQPAAMQATTRTLTPSAAQESKNSIDVQSLSDDTLPSLPEEPKTFFSTAPHKFQDVHITENNGIPTKSFLAACSNILPFFDVLGSTAFAPVKIDIGGNIKKLSSKFDTEPMAFSTLQSMIYQEIKSNSCTAKNSATDALLWLKRALEFMNIFLDEVVKGRQDLAIAAGIAYENSLRKYHGWVVRGVFALAVKAVPYREDFLTALGTVDEICASHQQVLKHMKTTVESLGNLIQILNIFYRKHNLDAQYTV